MNTHVIDHSLIAEVAGTLGHRSAYSALELMRVSLAILDSVGVPGDIGARLDHSISSLEEHLGIEPSMPSEL